MSRVRRMHEAPTPIDVRVLDQPLDRTRAEMLLRRCDLTLLLRDVNMNRLARRQRSQDGSQRLRRYCAQAVQRHADFDLWRLRVRARQFIDEVEIAIRRQHELTLSRGRR